MSRYCSFRSSSLRQPDGASIIRPVRYLEIETLAHELAEAEGRVDELQL